MSVRTPGQATYLFESSFLLSLSSSLYQELQPQDRYLIGTNFQVGSALNIFPIEAKGKHALFVKKMIPMAISFMRIPTARSVAQRSILTGQVDSAF
jgi:hypothetical protein